MPDTHRISPAATRRCALALVMGLGFGTVLPGCADIHPAGDDSGGGMLDAPDDEAEHDRETFEREAEHGEEAEGGRR